MFGLGSNDSHENDGLRRGLGWVSILVGVTELAATRQVARLVGVQGTAAEGVIRALGVRELCHGIDLLTHEDPAPGVWARVAGDLLDGAAMAAAARKTTNPGGLAAVAALVAPVVAADVYACAKLSGQKMLS